MARRFGRRRRRRRFDTTAALTAPCRAAIGGGAARAAWAAGAAGAEGRAITHAANTPAVATKASVQATRARFVVGSALKSFIEVTVSGGRELTRGRVGAAILRSGACRVSLSCNSQRASIHVGRPGWRSLQSRLHVCHAPRRFGAFDARVIFAPASLPRGRDCLPARRWSGIAVGRPRLAVRLFFLAVRHVCLARRWSGIAVGWPSLAVRLFFLAVRHVYLARRWCGIAGGCPSHAGRRIYVASRWSGVAGG